MTGNTEDFVNDLGLSVRTANALKALGVGDVEGLMALDKEHVLAVHGAGPGTWERVELLQAGATAAYRGHLVGMVTEKAQTLIKLRELMGYVEDSSQQWVRLSQDDATRSFSVELQCGAHYHSPHFEGAIAEAHKDQSE